MCDGQLWTKKYIKARVITLRTSLRPGTPAADSLPVLSLLPLWGSAKGLSGGTSGSSAEDIKRCHPAEGKLGCFPERPIDNGAVSEIEDVADLERAEYNPGERGLLSGISRGYKKL